MAVRFGPGGAVGSAQPYGPLPFTARTEDGVVHLVEEENADEFEHTEAFGRMTAFHGQMGMFTRALAYMLSHGADGLKQVAEDAVLNANYILRSLEDVLDAPFGPSGPCMHEALFSDKGFAEGLSTLDLAKGLIDEGYHPMTMYFPLVVHGTMLVEPTETEARRPRPVHHGAARRGRACEDRRRNAEKRAPLRPAAGSMKRRPHVSRCLPGAMHGVTQGCSPRGCSRTAPITIRGSLDEPQGGGV